MERSHARCGSTWVEELHVFHGYRGSGQVLGYDILCFPGLGVVDWLQGLRRHWGQQHLNHSMCFPCRGILNPFCLAWPSQPSFFEEHHAAASCTHVGCYGTATSFECADMLSATSILGHGCSVHLLGALLEAFPVLSHRKKKISSSQTLLPLVTGVT